MGVHRHSKFRSLAAALVLTVPAAFAGPAQAEQVGEVGVDWLGNDISIEAVKDPEAQGVT